MKILKSWKRAREIVNQTEQETEVSERKAQEVTERKEKE